MSHRVHRDDGEEITLHGEEVHRTAGKDGGAGAVLMRVSGKEVWLPRSQIRRMTAIAGDVEFVIPLWLAENRGIA